MERPNLKCISCLTTDLLFGTHEIDYASCKPSNGKPCIPCQERIELDAVISQTRETLKNLLSRRRDLCEELNGRHDPIIRDLPVEVSAHIFLFALSEDLPGSILRSGSADHCEGLVITTPLTLGAVCRTWRSIAFASPSLWTKISIPVKATDDMKYLDIADDWLKRACILPLSMYIYAPQMASPPQKLLDQLSCLIHRYLHRCCSLEVSGPIDYLPTITGEAPLLAHIKITSDISSFGNHHRKIKLRSTKQGVRLWVEGRSIQLLQLPPCSNIDSLEGHEIFPSSIRTFILQTGCNLRRLYLNNLTRRGGLCDLLRSTNSLEELYLVERNVKTIEVEGLFWALTDTHFLPNLSTFSINIRDEGFPWDLAVQIFGPLDGTQNPVRRPIKHFQVIYDWCLGNMLRATGEDLSINDEIGPTLFLSEEVTRRFLDVAREGVNIDLQDLYAQEDIFMLAMEYHNIDVPEWYQIKSYAGISELDALDFDYDSSMTDDSEDLERESADFAADFESDSGSDSDVDSEESELDEEEEYRRFLLGFL